MRPPKLKRSVGLWMATALVVGNMIGSGVFLLRASLADTAGPVSMLGWLFTGAGAILLALVFASRGRALPRTGGPYTYAKRAIAGAGDDIVTKGFVLLLSGIPVYPDVRRSLVGYSLRPSADGVTAKRAGRGRRLRAQRRHQHAAAPRGDRGDHDRRLRARPWSRRRRCMSCPIERVALPGAREETP